MTLDSSTGWYILQNIHLPAETTIYFGTINSNQFLDVYYYSKQKYEIKYEVQNEDDYTIVLDKNGLLNPNSTKPEDVSKFVKVIPVTPF